MESMSIFESNDTEKLFFIEQIEQWYVKTCSHTASITYIIVNLMLLGPNNCTLISWKDSCMCSLVKMTKAL